MLLTHWLSMSVALTAGGHITQADTQTPPATITFEEPAAPLSRLMPDLAAATHRPLKVAPVIANEVLLINVHDVSVDDLLTHMAQAVGGIWTSDKTGYYLAPEVAKRAHLTELGLATRTARLASDLKQMSPEAKAATKKDATPGKVDFTAAMFGQGGDEVFYHLLSAIGPQQLATLDTGDRAVLSTRPTAKQFQLPDSGDWLSAFIARKNSAAAKAKERAAARAAKNGDGGDGGDEGGDEGGPDEEMAGSGFVTGFPGGNKSIDKPPAKSILVLERNSGPLAFFGGQDITAELVLFDDKGNILARDRGGVGNDSEELELIMAESQGKKKPVTDEKPIELSPESKLFNLYMRSMGGSPDGKATKISEEQKTKALEQISHPETYDPLAYPADLLVGLGKAKHEQVVACLPDAFSSWLIMMFMGQETASGVEKKLSKDQNLVMDNTNGWITISPNSFRYEPINRADLKKLCDLMKATKNPSIEQLATVSRSGIGEAGRGVLTQLWLAVVDMGVGFDQNWAMLRLYSSFSPEQRQSLSQNKRLTFNSLTADQQETLGKMIYGASDGMSFFSFAGRLSVENKPDQNSLLGPAESAIESSFEEYGADGMPPNDYRSEPTEAAPSGLPAGTAITFRESSTQVLTIVKDPRHKSDTNEGYYNQTMGVEQIASMVAMNERPQDAESMAMMPKFDHVKVGTKRTLHFRIYVSPESFLPCEISECSFPEGSTYALNALPGDLQKKFDEQLKMMREAYKNSGSEGGPPDTGGGGAAPPR